MSDNKYLDAINASKVTEDDAAVTAAVQKILDEHEAENHTQDIYKFLFNRARNVWRRLPRVGRSRRTSRT